MTLGLDAIPLKADSLKVFVQHYNGDGTVDGDKIYPETGAPTKSGTSYKFVVPLSTSSGLVIGQNYLFGVEGTDQNGNPVVASGAGWGFHLASSGAAPDLIVTSPDPNGDIILRKGSDLRVTGYTAAEEGVPTVKIYLGTNLLANPNLTKRNDGYYDFDVTLTSDKFSQDTTRTYNLKITSEAEGKAEEKINVVYDVTPPVIKNLRITTPKTTTHSDKPGIQNIINKITKFEGTITDSKGIKEIAYEVYQKYSDEKITRATGNLNSFLSPNDNTSCDFTIELNTEDSGIEDEKPLFLEITTKDIAGNVTTENNIQECYVYQKSDEPVYKSTSTVFDVSIESEDGIVDKNKFAKTRSPQETDKGAELPLSIIDDDGIKKATIKIYKKDDYEKKQNEDVKPYSTYDQITNIELPQEVGVYVVEIDITDEADTSFPSKAIYVKVTGNNPEVEITGIPSYVKTGDEFTVLIKITDEERGPYVVTASDGSDLSNLTEIENSDDRYESGKIIYEHKITADSTKEQKYKITDENGTGLSTNKVASYKLDDSKPTITTKPTPPTTDETEQSSFPFTGNAEDTGSGVAKVEIDFDEDHSSVYTASGTEEWIYKARFDELNLTEGKNKIYVRAIDKVSNEGEWETVDFIYDTASPVISYSNIPSQLSKDSYTLKGTIIEGYGIKGNKITVIETVNGDEKKKDDVSVTRGKGENTYNWEVSIPLEGHKNESGKFTYKFIVKDEADKELLENDSFSLNRDLIPPEVKLTIPNNNSYGENSINATETLIKGTITEESPNKLYYELYKKNETEPLEYTEVDISAYPGTNQIWSFSVTGLTEGEWSFKYYADDISGNKVDPVTQDFMVDLSEPVITYKLYRINDSNEEMEVTGSDIALTSKVTSEDSETFILKGTVTDSNGINSFKVNNKPVTPDSDGKWEYKPDVPTEQKTYNFEIETEDKSGNGNDIKGKKTTLSRKVMFDKTKPTVTISGLDNDLDWLQGSGNTYISGNAIDSESGLQSIKIQIDDNPEKSLPLADTWTDKINVDSLDENIEDENSYHTVKLTVKDNVDLESILERKFKLDRSIPIVETFTATRTHINKTDNANNTNKVMFSGQIYDGDLTSYRAVKAAYLVATKKDTDGVYKLYDLNTLNSADITTYGMPLSLSSETNANFGYFSQEIELTGTNDLLSDGTYKFKVVGYDLSGRECSSTELQLIVDTTSPVVADPILSNWGDKSTYTSGDHKSSSVTISSSITESNPDTVYYYLYDGSDSSKTKETVSDGEWNLFSGSKTISLPDGKNQIWIKAVDKASNIGYSTSSTWYYVDTSAPESLTLTSVDGKTLTGDKLTNGSSAITVKVNVKDFNNAYKDDGSAREGDDPTRVALVNLASIGSNQITNPADVANGKGAPTITDSKKTGEWTVTIPTSALEVLSTGTYQVKLSVQDNAGNEKKYDVFKVDIDKTYPTVTINSPADADKSTTDIDVNNDVILSGTVSDNKDEISEIHLEYYDATASEWKPVTGIDSEATVTKNGNSWSATLDSTKFTDGTSVQLRAVATDAAGNTGNSGTASPYDDSKKISISINQDSDRPVITFSSMKLKTSDTTPVAMAADHQIWLKSQTLYGSVIDDDGITEVKVIAKPSTATEAPSEEEWSAALNIYDNGSWEYNAIEGYSKLYFRVKDSASKTFTSFASTDNTTISNTPKLTDKDSTPNKYGYKVGAGITGKTNVYSTILYIQVDTEDPKIEGDVYYREEPPVASPANTDWEATFTNPEGNGWKKLSALNSYIGGPNKNLYVYYISRDTNGLNNTVETLGNVTATKVYPYASPTAPYSIDNTEYKQVVKFDISSAASSAAVSLVVNVNDRASRSYFYSRTLQIDNEAPEITPRSHNSGVEVYGSSSVQFTGRATDTTEIKKIFYTITKENTKPAQNTFTEITEYISPLSWAIAFDGGTNSNNGLSTIYHDKLLNDLVNDKYNDEYKSGSVDSIPMYIWIYGEDSLGNSGYTTVESTEFIVITQADKPSISISYPLSGDKVGGTVRVSGSASIVDPEKTVSAIWAQIDPDYNPETETDISSSWETELNDLITDKSVGYEIANGPEGIGNAIKVSGTNNWNLPINVAGEFTKKDNGNNILVNRVVAMKLFAVSSSGKISNPAIVYFTVDPEAPVFGEMTLVQYDTDGNTIIAKRKYESNMWISGQWYLTGEVTDGSGIKSIMKDTSNLPDNEKESAGNNNYYLKIPVGQPATNTNAKGKTEFTLKATENTENNLSSEVRISINYDNKAPDFTYTRTETEINNNSISVKQDNGQYTLRGTVTEAGDESGLSRVAFYFTRTKKDGKTYYIDPLTAKGTNGIENQFEVSASPSADGLYWTTINGAKVEETDVSEIDLGSNSVPAYIRNGGLCKVDKVVYRIKEVSGNKVKVEGKLSVGTNISVDFAYAQVIDNTSSEDGKTSTYNETTVIYDDGDKMWEQIRQTTTNYQWSASIDSKNIYDGPVTLHFVAYDAAGNSVSSSYSGMVSNNAPKIASVTVGTDFDGDGTISDNEKKIQFTSTESVAHDSKEYSKSVTNKLIVSSDRTTNGKAFMTLKDASVIIPEIVGGNGNLYYSYNIGTTIGAAENIKGENKTYFATGVDNSIDGYALSSTVTKDGYKHYSITARETYVQGQKPEIKLGLSDFNDYMSKGEIKNTEDENNPTWFCYTIWDETDGLEKFKDSQNATIQVALNVQVHDKVAPSAKIKPFYWTNKDENSLYENSTANGHIELESDLTDDMTTPYKDTNKEKPKVSGKITLKGTAYDNVRLSKIYVIFDNDSDLGTKKLAAEFKNKDGSSKMEWIPATASIDKEGWQFSISTPSDEAFMNEDGHQVAWQLDIDTQKLPGGVGLNKAIKILVEDARGEVNENGTIKYGKSSEVGTTQTKTGAETAYYKMDVVPYVTAVGTKFAGKDKSIKGSYSRTSSGKYIVASNEKGITLTGFNLTGGTVIFNKESTENTAANYQSQLSNDLKFSIASEARTGAFKVVVNGVDSINNTNNNNAAGDSGKKIANTSSYSDMTNYAYNRCPNNISNNLLTDDLWFDIWELNNRAATSRGALKDPVMHINQASTDKEIGFGFVNAADGVSFPADGNSYVWFQKNRKDYKGTNFVYDNNGVAHNISIGLDAQASTGIAGRMNYNNSNWYSNSSKGADGTGDGTIAQWNKRFNIALETIGIPKGIVVKGTRLTANNIDTDRFATPSMAVSTHGANKVPTVYIMYYDFDHDQIRFRYGEINNTDTTNKSRQDGDSTGTKETDDYNSTATIYNYYQYGLLNDSECELNSDSDGNGKDSSKNISRTEITSDTAASNNLWSYHHMFEASKDYYALVAGKYYKQDNNGKDSFDTGNQGSAYYGLDVVSGDAIGDDKVVMIWYDESTQNLMYMYRENLTAAGDNTDASSNGVANKWSKPVPLVEDTLLQDCVIKVDSKGGIHIAYYDQTNADLIYGYMSGYNKASEFKTCVVDAYSQVGNRISIETAVNAKGDKVVPYISYFSDGLSSLPKMAYLPNGVSSATDVVDGADADTTLFTGNWEVTLIPTSSVLQPYNVGIGVWKDANGKATKHQTEKPSVAYNPTNYTQTCYANGSSELVVGYSIKANGVGYMETAMRR